MLIVFDVVQRGLWTSCTVTYRRWGFLWLVVRRVHKHRRRRWWTDERTGEMLWYRNNSRVTTFGARISALVHLELHRRNVERHREESRDSLSALVDFWRAKRREPGYRDRDAIREDFDYEVAKINEGLIKANENWLFRRRESK